MPDSLLTAVWVSPRATSFAVTVAPTMAPPLGSVTVPVIDAVTSCPHAAFALQSSATSVIKTSPNPKDCFVLILIPPIRGRRFSGALSPRLNLLLGNQH